MFSDLISKVNTVTKEYVKAFAFVFSNNFAISSSGEKITLKTISTKEESEEADEFHDSQKCLRQSSSKKISKKIFMVFACF